MRTPVAQGNDPAPSPSLPSILWPSYTKLEVIKLWTRSDANLDGSILEIY